MTEKIDRKKQNSIIKKNALMSISFKGMEYILAFFTTPILLNCLGNYKYGVYTTTLSLVSWIYYFDFGIGNGLRNKVSEFIVKEDYESAHKSINVAYILVSIISIIAFMIVFVLSFFLNYDEIFNANLTDENLNVIMVIAIFLACLNFVLTLSTNILNSMQCTGLVSGLGILSKSLMVVALILFRVLNIKSMIAVVVIEGFAQLIKNVIAMIYIYIRQKIIA